MSGMWEWVRALMWPDEPVVVDCVRTSPWAVLNADAQLADTLASHGRRVRRDAEDAMRRELAEEAGRMFGGAVELDRRRRLR